MTFGEYKMTTARIFACAMLYLNGWRSSDKRLLMYYFWLNEEETEEICQVLAKFEEQTEGSKND